MKSNTIILEEEKILRKKDKVISRFRRRMGDYMRVMLIPLALLLFFLIVEGIFKAVLEEVTLNTNVKLNLQKVVDIFQILIALIPFFITLTIASTFSTNRALGAALAVLGWTFFIGAQSFFISLTPTGQVSLFNSKILTSSRVIDIISQKSGILFVSPNIFVGLFMGIQIAKVVSKLNKTSKKTNTFKGCILLTFILVIFVAIFNALLHISFILSLVYGLESGVKNIENLANDSVNIKNLLYSLILSVALPFENANSFMAISTQQSYLAATLSIFVAPLISFIFFCFTIKGDMKKYAVPFFLFGMMASLFFGRYEVILLTLLIASPFMFFINVTIFGSLISWISSLAGANVGATNLIEFVKDFSVSDKSYLFLGVGLGISVLVIIVTALYVKFTKVGLPGLGSVSSKIYRNELGTDLNYIVFPKYEKNAQVDQTTKLFKKDTELDMLVSAGMVYGKNIQLLTNENLVLDTSEQKRITQKTSHNITSENLVNTEEINYDYSNNDNFKPQSSSTEKTSDLTVTNESWSSDLNLDLSETSEPVAIVQDYEKTTEITPPEDRPLVLKDSTLSTENSSISTTTNKEQESENKENVIVEDKPVLNEKTTTIIFQPNPLKEIPLAPIEDFAILSPLLGDVMDQNENSIDILASSGKFVLANEATIEYVSENKDLFVLNIYGVRMEINLNPNFEKSHKQRLHNRVYLAVGKKVRKGDFLLDVNKKFYSEIGERMIVTIRLLDGNYHVNKASLKSRIEKNDKLFDIHLNEPLQP